MWVSLLLVVGGCILFAGGVLKGCFGWGVGLVLGGVFCPPRVSEGELCRGKDRTEDSKGGGWTDETWRRVKYCLAKIGTQTSGRQTQTAVSGRADLRRDNDAGHTTIGQDGMPAAYKSPHMSRPRHRRSCRDPIMPPPSPDQVAPRDIQGPHKDHPGAITPRAPPPIRTAPGKKPSMPIRRCTTDTTSLSGTGRCTASVAQGFSHGRAGRGQNMPGAAPLPSLLSPPRHRHSTSFLPTTKPRTPTARVRTRKRKPLPVHAPSRHTKHLARERQTNRKTRVRRVQPPCNLGCCSYAAASARYEAAGGWAIYSRLSYWPGSFPTVHAGTCVAWWDPVNSSVLTWKGLARVEG